MYPAGHFVQNFSPVSEYSPELQGTGAEYVDAHDLPAGQVEHTVFPA